MVEAKLTDFSPDWMTWEIEQALAKLPTRKHRTTVLRLAEAKAIGVSWSSLWERPEVCSKTTWYGRYKQDGSKVPGWQENPDVQAALELAIERAQGFHDSYIVRQIAETQKALAKWGPGAVTVLSNLMLNAVSENIKRLSALDILDRLGAGEVASKAIVPNTPGELGISIREVVVEMPAEENEPMADRE